VAIHTNKSVAVRFLVQTKGEHRASHGREKE
jgi:hypothetical protein